MTFSISRLSRRVVLRHGSLLAAAALLAACGKPADTAATAASASSAAVSAPAKVYAVGTDAVYAPFESQNEKGEIVGFDIDVLQAVADQAGLTLKFVNTPWEGMFNTLSQGDRDILVSAITITDERKQTMDFSAPYFNATQLIAVPSASKITRFDELKNLRVAVQTGTTGDEAASKLMGITNSKLRRFENTPLALKELESGGVDAVVADNGVIAHYVANNGSQGFKAISDASFVPEQYGFVVKKGDTALAARLNQGLAAIRADGTYERIHAQYFGAASAAAVAAASAASK
jgi:polar amino acid transport system substrate-binding protein